MTFWRGVLASWLGGAVHNLRPCQCQSHIVRAGLHFALYQAYCAHQHAVWKLDLHSMLHDSRRGLPYLSHEPARTSARRAHLEVGEALAPLRDEGVLIYASGMSFHNMQVRRVYRSKATCRRKERP